MYRLSFLLLALLPLSLLAADEGVLPIGKDGKPLNLDFETGTLKDWTAEGDAFKDQPIKGDTVHPRRGDSYSRHQGQFWIGGFERFGDKPTGTLTSVPFKVTHRWASFLVGGGPWKETRVELLSGKEVFHTASGMEEEDMRREVVDLIKYMGKEIQVRLVDKHTGHWGHINFDDFRFHENKPTFPARPKAAPPSPPDVYKNAGLTPEKAAAAMTVPEDFKVTLFAGEPDVHQPIAFCIDDRGRLWVAEAYAYPKRLPFDGPLLPEAQKKNGDRILIFEDTKGTGTFDKKTVFIEGLNLISGIEIGFGGVWVGAAPYLMFIPNNDDKPGVPKILLDGWDATSDTHETLNTFCWGPDGWLYGCHGVFTRSRVGKPGTPDKDRVPLNCGVWRYHPTRHIFEVFSEGTSNPWGLDYNENGEFFIEACVIPHCFHMIQGGRYLRQAGQHFNPYTYADIGTIADHLHYIGATPHGGNNRSDSAGGGHAHCGLMCYLGGAWPEKYKGQLFMGNIHGRRINMDILKPKGSGYVASHGPDFLLANDEWARFINLKYGPDGNVYLIDWYDKQACHRNEPEIWDRTNGRIYKISYRGTKPATGLDLQKASDFELANYQLYDNEWYVRHARRILQERHTGPDAAEKVKETEATARRIIQFTTDKDPTKRLKALWALNALGYVGDLADETDPVVRAWAIRLWIDDSTVGTKSKPLALETLVKAAKTDSSPLVRRALASGLQRLAPKDRKDVLAGLLAHTEDAADFNLPLLYWYSLEPLAGEDPQAAFLLAINGKIPSLIQFTSRRIAATSTVQQIDDILPFFVKGPPAKEIGLAALRGFNEGVKGRRDLSMPPFWDAVVDTWSSKNEPEFNSLLSSLSIAFGDPKAFAAMRKVLADTKASTADRQAALAALINGRDKELPPILQKLVAEPSLRAAAIRALAGYDDPKSPGVILAQWKSYSTSEQRDALNTLVSRPAFANALLDAVGNKQLQPSDISADIIKAMRNLPDTSLGDKIAKVWGAVRDTPADRAKDIAAWKKKLSVPGKDDLMLGRALYAKTCQNCHTLYGVGGKIGPDITGSNRANLDYILENVFDPSAVIPKDYAQSVLNLNNGRTITGIVKGDNGVAYTVQTPNEVLIINKGDVDELKPSAVSMMPDDQMKPFSEKEVRALFAYLRHNQQVPMLATTENAKDFFNGKDLTGWVGDPKLWSVDNGEIVGKTTGLKKNEFLMSTIAAENFKLSFKVKLVPNAGNSGMQFRSEGLPDGEMKGPQADIGVGWWGKLYEENGRAILENAGGEKFVKQNEWNDYTIEAIDGNVKLTINGNVCCDRKDDAQLSRRGIFGMQLHSGPAQEVRFKELKLEVLPKK
ncbi:MAG TPA: PVC-type heme-binding CxxCH protein [Gemmataceae bacterium]|jgi:putative membrane-bound dehydrogenase-like protein|nr:PVC-type heme-binding CxxCH protein [Gemmataceae bacterium]